MAAQNLPELVAQLSPADQATVQQFIEFLKSDRGNSSNSPFLTAVDKFITEHPELLRRLAQPHFQCRTDAGNLFSEWRSPEDDAAFKDLG